MNLRDEGWLYFVPTAALFVVTSPVDSSTGRHHILMKRLQTLLDDSGELGPLSSRFGVRWAQRGLDSGDAVTAIWGLYLVPVSAPGLLDVIESGLRHPSPSVRCEAAMLCGRKHLAAAHELADLLLLLVASDEDMAVRICTTLSVAKARVRPEVTVGLFLALLRESDTMHSSWDREFRRALIRGLGYYGEYAGDAIDPLLRYSRHDLVTKQVAIEALGNIGIPDARVLERLEEAARSPTYRIHRRAKAALEQLASDMEGENDIR